MHCPLALCNLHSLLDRPEVEQVQCLVQLHHHETCSWARQMDEQLTVEIVLNPPVGVYIFLFCPPNEPILIK